MTNFGYTEEANFMKHYDKPVRRAPFCPTLLHPATPGRALKIHSTARLSPTTLLINVMSIA
jgi:hypothetical protein